MKERLSAMQPAHLFTFIITVSLAIFFISWEIYTVFTVSKNQNICTCRRGENWFAVEILLSSAFSSFLSCPNKFKDWDRTSFCLPFSKYNSLQKQKEMSNDSVWTCIATPKHAGRLRYSCEVIELFKISKFLEKELNVA